MERDLILDENEADHIKSLELISEKKYNANRKAESVGFYGARLKFLCYFYNIEAVQVAKACRVNKAIIYRWWTNESTPSSKHIARFALLFEISVRFFRYKEVNIKIIGQDRLEITYGK